VNFENIIFEESHSIAKIKLNRPKIFNALDFDLCNEMVKALEFCSESEDTRVVVITGEGQAFCAGGDLRVFGKYLETNPSEVFRQLIKVFNVIIMGIRSLPKPVIAVINGAVGGGGGSLAAACDLRIAASSAIFKQAYTSIGLVPDGAWTLLIPALIGFGKATELILLDPVINAQKALEMGLVNMVVEDAELERVSSEIASKLASGPTRSFGIAKENLTNAMFGLLERQLELERSGMIKAAKTADYKEGLKAFFEKKQPKFSGR
jgi:2-(1,2-epoxy-1,2-dihydrophenyl)acetyl-CoA isomerase